MNTVSRDDYLLARGANPRTGLITPGFNSVAGSVNDERAIKEPGIAQSAQWKVAGDQWVSIDPEKSKPSSETLERSPLLGQSSRGVSGVVQKKSNNAVPGAFPTDDVDSPGLASSKKPTRTPSGLLPQIDKVGQKSINTPRTFKPELASESSPITGSTDAKDSMASKLPNSLGNFVCISDNVYFSPDDVGHKMQDRTRRPPQPQNQQSFLDPRKPAQTWQGKYRVGIPSSRRGGGTRDLSLGHIDLDYQQMSNGQYLLPHSMSDPILQPPAHTGEVPYPRSDMKQRFQNRSRMPTRGHGVVNLKGPARAYPRSGHINPENSTIPMQESTLTSPNRITIARTPPAVEQVQPSTIHSGPKLLHPQMDQRSVPSGNLDMYMSTIITTPTSLRKKIPRVKREDSSTVIVNDLPPSPSMFPVQNTHLVKFSITGREETEATNLSQRDLVDHTGVLDTRMAGQTERTNYGSVPLTGAVREQLPSFLSLSSRKVEMRHVPQIKTQPPALPQHKTTTAEQVPLRKIGMPATNADLARISAVERNVKDIHQDIDQALTDFTSTTKSNTPRRVSPPILSGNSKPLPALPLQVSTNIGTTRLTSEIGQSKAVKESNGLHSHAICCQRRCVKFDSRVGCLGRLSPRTSLEEVTSVEETASDKTKESLKESVVTADTSIESKDVFRRSIEDVNEAFLSRHNRTESKLAKVRNAFIDGWRKNTSGTVPTLSSLQTTPTASFDSLQRTLRDRSASPTRDHARDEMRKRVTCKGTTAAAQKAAMLRDITDMGSVITTTTSNVSSQDASIPDADISMEVTLPKLHDRSAKQKAPKNEGFATRTLLSKSGKVVVDPVPFSPPVDLAAITWQAFFDLLYTLLPTNGTLRASTFFRANPMLLTSLYFLGTQTKEMSIKVFRTLCTTIEILWMCQKTGHLFLPNDITGNEFLADTIRSAFYVAIGVCVYAVIVRIVTAVLGIFSIVLFPVKILRWIIG